MNQENFNTRKARQGILPMGVGVTLGIVLGTALGNVAIGLVVGIVLAGMVIVWQKRK